MTLDKIAAVLKNISKKQWIAFACTVLFLLLLLRAFLVLRPIVPAGDTDLTEGQAALKAQEDKVLSEVADKIEALDAADAARRAADAEEIARREAIASGRGEEEDLYNTMVVRDADELRKTLVDNNAYCLGDSMVEGLHDGAFVNDSSLIYSRGGSVYNSEDIFYTAIDLRPSILFIYFGVNEPSTYDGNISSFKARYEELLGLLQENLPDCRIFIHTIHPLRMDIVRDLDPSLYNYYDQYNEAIAEVAEDTGVGLIDHSSLIAGHNELYWTDGQHPVNDVYLAFLSHDCYVAGI